MDSLLFFLTALFLILSVLLSFSLGRKKDDYGDSAQNYVKRALNSPQPAPAAPYPFPILKKKRKPFLSKILDKYFSKQRTSYFLYRIKNVPDPSRFKQRAKHWVLSQNDASSIPHK